MARCAVVIVFALLVTTAGAFALDGRAGPVPFDLDDEGAVVVSVEIAGQGPFELLIDSGSSHTAITPDTAARLGVRPVAKTELVSAAGRRLAAVVPLGRVVVGTASVEGLLATVADPALLARAGRHLDGVLGQDFLRRFVYTIDYRRRQLTWGEHDGGSRLALEEEGGRFLVVVPQRDGGSRRFVPDTGSSHIVLFQRHGHDLPLDLTPRGRAWLDSLTSRRDVYVARISRLTIGSATLSDVTASVIQEMDAEAPGGDGLLPLHLFARVTINAPARWMSVSP
jgi:predicted aspartyl protease